MSYDFHDFELILPIIGPIPDLMIPEGSSGHKVSTAPFKIITITSVMLVVKKQVCRTELTKDQHLAMYTVSNSDRPILTFYNRYRYRLFKFYLTDNRYSEPIFIYCFKVNK